MDIGMSLLFGGFPQTFYDAYNSVFSLADEWQGRVHLTQLYPLLVHAVLFSGSYINRCRNILNEWK
jgi:fructosamine-3-kinase